jgi:hypothetical protein
VNRPCLPGIALLYQGGVKMREIKALTGHHDHVITRALDRFSVERRRPARCINETPLNQRVLRRRYEAGASTMSLAELYGCDQRTIAKYLRRAGATLRSKGARPKARIARASGDGGAAIIIDAEALAIIADYRAGALLKDIQASHGISRDLLKRVLRENGVPHRTPKGFLPPR